MKKYTKIRRLTTGYFVLCVVYFSILSTNATEACIICTPYPQTTLADRLIVSDAVVMAREIAEKPYSFYVVKVLKGDSSDKAFDASITSTARQMLLRNADDVIVFSREKGESWQFMAYADPEYQKFIQAILKQSSRWQRFRGERRRIGFFVKYLNHNHPDIREQAYLELSQAPYASITRVAGTVPRQQIHEILSDRRFVEWHSLYILMLGQSRHPDDLAHIREHLESAAADGIRKNLSAWVTAFIETHPNTGVKEIETLYFNQPGRKPDELKEVMKGLFVLGSEVGSHKVFARRRRIVSSFSTLLKNYPTMAGIVARNLMVWEIRSLVPQLSDIVESESDLDLETQMAVFYYLSIAPRFPAIE